MSSSDSKVAPKTTENVDFLPGPGVLYDLLGNAWLTKNPKPEKKMNLSFFFFVTVRGVIIMTERWQYTIDEHFSTTDSR